MASAKEEYGGRNSEVRMPAAPASANWVCDSSQSMPRGRLVGEVGVGEGVHADLVALGHHPVDQGGLAGDQTIALTFDDGPDPTWTPQGPGRAARSTTCRRRSSWSARRSPAHPDLVRDDRRATGYEIGVAHLHPPRPGHGPPWRRRLRADRDAAALSPAPPASRTVLLRPPYSSSADAIDDAGWRDRPAPGEQGYITVAHRPDSEDWQRPGRRTRSCATPTPQAAAAGAIVLHARRRRRPVADRRRAGPVHPADAGARATASPRSAARPARPAAPTRRVAGAASCAAARALVARCPAGGRLAVLR